MELEQAKKIISNVLGNCNNQFPKLKENTSSKSLCRNRIKALEIVLSLFDCENNYNEEEISLAIKQIESIKNKCTTGYNNARDGSSTKTRFKNLIDAMNIALEYLGR